jgi:hypothetical protein
MLYGTTFAQKNLGREWYVGSPNYKITFDDDTAYSQLLNPMDKRYPRVISSNANICDSNGHFLVGSTGMNLYNNMGELVDSNNHVNNDTFRLEHGFYAYPNNSIILPKKNNQYYIFTCTQSDAMANGYHYGWVDTFDFDQILYSIVDMNANNGQGAIIENRKLLLQAKSPWINKSNFTCTRHANGRDWWMIKPSARDRNIKYRYLVTPDTIISFIDLENKNLGKFNNDNVGQSCFSSDGSLYVECNKSSLHTIYNFDRCSGQLSLNRIIDITPYTKTKWDRFDGVCFSSNNQFLYTSDEFFIYQIDLNEPNDSLAVQCVSYQDTVYFPGYNTMQMSPNGQIVMGSWAGVSPYWNAIMYPNEKGMACGFKTDYVVSSYYHAGPINTPFNDPPNMPFFELGALVGSPCDTVKQNTSPYTNWLIYPNPTQSNLTIHVPITNTNVQVAIYNILGQKVLQKTMVVDYKYKATLDISSLATGLYFVVIETGDKPFTSKISKY